MRNAFSALRSRSTLLAAVLCLGCCSASAATPGEEILDLAGVRGGLVVHVGCGDGTLTAQLHSGDRYLVHGLDASPAHVAGSGMVDVERPESGRVQVELEFAETENLTFRTSQTHFLFVSFPSD